MATWFVTGKLGAGKTLVSVSRIREYLQRGAPVATNLDINLDKLVGLSSKNACVYRLPDKPCVDDLNAIGVGNSSYDETKNGLIVLDECGTWFNSRNWNDKSRQALIDWLLHARKLGWDLIFIVQDISIVDKQARLALCEHMVVCRRIDRVLKIPFLESLVSMTGFKLPKPQVHLGIVKYGDNSQSITVDRWWYRGTDLYDAYDTKQVFSDSYHHQVFRLLPPYYTHGRYKVSRNWDFYMRMTRIYWKRFNTPLLAAFGLFLGAIFTIAFQPEPKQEIVFNVADPVQETEQSRIISDLPSTSDILPSPDDSEPIALDPLQGFKITGAAFDSADNLLYMSISNGTTNHTVQSLIAEGFMLDIVDKCAVVVYRDDFKKLLHTDYCHSNRVAKDMTDSEAVAYYSRIPAFRRQF